MRPAAKNFTLFLLAFLILAGFLSLLSSPNKAGGTIDFTEAVAAIKNGKIKSIAVDSDELQLTFIDNSQKLSHKESNESLAGLLKLYGVSEPQLSAVNIEARAATGFSAWLSALAPFLVPILLFLVFIYFTMRQLAGANNRAMMFGQSTAREQNPAQPDKNAKTTFADVAGNTEAKEELKEVVEFLRQPQKFLQLGARIPKGVLLVGPPGTGKTLLAKAVSGEAGVPFFHMSGSEFVEMFVGVGASRVRDLFRRAKKSAPAIVFVDELDAVGRQRGAGLGGSHDEREQTLNQILVEMDGFETDTNVIIVAATNRPDVLDPALLRPGRFDRRVMLDLPDIAEREQILVLHAKNKPLEAQVNLRKVAERTVGFSGADLSNLLNEAAILAARKNQKFITAEDIFISIEKVMLGPERKSFLMSEREKKITAYHEAGHAVVAHLFPSPDPVHKVSIIARGRTGGYTLKLPLEDKRLYNKSEFLADLAVLLAGHAIEQEIFNDVTTGASSDLRKATALARQIATEFGMSEKLGPRTFGNRDELVFLGRTISEQRDYGEKTAQTIDEEISRLIREAYEAARKIIKNNRERIERVAAVLLEKETLEREEFARLMAG